MPQWWPFVDEQLAIAVRRGGVGTTIEEVRRDLEAGLAHLWLALIGGYIVGSAVTMLVAARGRKRCELVAFAGQLDRCRDMLPRLEAYARDEGCEAMRVMGRPGWRRALPGYMEPFVTMEKRL